MDYNESISNSKMPMNQTHFNSIMDDIKHDVLDDDYEVEMDKDGLIKPNAEKLSKKWRSKVKREYSQVVVVSSMKQNGMGKSALLYWCAKGTDGNKFSFDNNFFFRGGLDKIKEKTEALDIGSSICMDEMVRLWYKRGAMSRRNVDLNEWMAADQRKTGVVLIGAIPDFWDLDSYARDGKVDWYIEVLGRGVGLVFKADHFPMVSPWHPEEMRKIQGKRTSQNESPYKKLKLLENHPCYVQTVFWSKMPKVDKKTYLEALNKSAKDAEAEDPRSNNQIEIDDIKQHYQKAELKQASSILKMIDMLDLRGCKLSFVLKESGLDLKTYKHFDKINKAFERRVKNAKEFTNI